MENATAHTTFSFKMSYGREHIISNQIYCIALMAVQFFPPFLITDEKFYGLEWMRDCIYLVVFSGCLSTIALIYFETPLLLKILGLAKMVFGSTFLLLYVNTVKANNE